MDFWIRSFEVINLLVRRFGYQSYLEIGCAQNYTFNKIECPKKTGVDPYSGGTHRMTSDAFFLQNRETFDIVYVDGWHERSQVRRDVLNSLRFLNPGGAIVMHDCLPPTELEGTSPEEFERRTGESPNPPFSRSWCGDVWKTAVEIRSWPFPDFAVINSDYGIGIIRPRPNSLPLDEPDWTVAAHADELTWDDFTGWVKEENILRLINNRGELDSFIGERL